MKKRKEISRKDYQEKFDRLMKSFNFSYQDGEEIVQCKDPYPPYWFVSNKGYVISVRGNGIKYIAAGIRYTNKRNKKGERTGRHWFLRYSVNGKKGNVTLHKLVADHFIINEFTGDQTGDNHHIVPKSSFADNEWKACNEAGNLQKLPPEIHQELTWYSHRPAEKIEAEMDQKAIEDHAEVTEVPKEQFTDQMVALANTLIQQGVDCRVYTVRDNDQAAAAYPVAGIATHMAADGSVTYRFIKKDPK